MNPMWRKGWVDVEGFITAWLVAMTLHGVQPEPDLVKKAIARTPTPAQLKKERRQFDADLEAVRRAKVQPAELKLHNTG